VDLASDHRGAEELHRPRQRRAVSPQAVTRIEDLHLGQHLLAAPAADQPELTAEDDDGSGVERRHVSAAVS
jgi:hypothetical protein